MFLQQTFCLPASCITQYIFVSKYIMYLTDQISVKLGFILAICYIIAQYNLRYILNNHSRDSSLSTESAWKNTVRQVIDMREYSLWEQRLTVNKGTCFFQVQQPGIEPSIVYYVTK